MTKIDIKQGAVLKVGDTAPELRVQLLDNSGDVVDISGATVKITVRRNDADVPIVDTNASIIDATNGIIEYDWQSGDTNEHGTYDAEIRVTQSGDTITYPNDRYFTIRIMENLQ